MISIIICSRDKEMLSTVSQSVQKTIGVPYEIISIDNSKGQYSIFQAYNVGAQKSKFNYLCFMHEDLFFKTLHWGKKLITYLSDPAIGLIGVAGSTYKSRNNSAWWGAPGVPDHYRRFCFEQSDTVGTKPELYYLNPHEEVMADVVVLDGLWLATRQETWQKNKFDEQHFKGFHFYDLDFSLQINQSLRVCVVYDILIEHRSHGNVNKSWAESAMIFHEKWEKKLPVSVSPILPVELQRFEFLTANDFLQTLERFGYPKTTILKFRLRYLQLYTAYLQIYSFRDFLWLLKEWMKRPFEFLQQSNN